MSRVLKDYKIVVEYSVPRLQITTDSTSYAFFGGTRTTTRSVETRDLTATERALWEAAATELRSLKSSMQGIQKELAYLKMSPTERKEFDAREKAAKEYSAYVGVPSGSSFIWESLG